MKRLTMILTLALISAALAQVPVTRWHNNPAMELPYGAMRSDGPECDRLIALVGQAGNDTGACYGWLDALGGAVYSLFTLQAQAAGYVIADERVLPDPLLGVLVVLVNEALIEGVFFLYQDGAVMAVAFSEDR